LRLARPLVTILFRHMDKILPVDRLCENEYWMAFHHPKPEYPLHILILPKQGLPTLGEASHLTARRSFMRHFLILLEP